MKGARRSACLGAQCARAGEEDAAGMVGSEEDAAGVEAVTGLLGCVRDGFDGGIGDPVCHRVGIGLQVGHVGAVVG